MLSDWSVLFRLLLAAVLSGVIGFEREFHGRAAGFRTHILLCIGSTLIMLTSMHIFDIYYPRISPDPARIAAGVITGIGFLGAGTILHFKSSVRGLTTAASLWVVSGIGLAVGSGFISGAVLTALLTLVTLMIFSKLEYSMIRKDWYRTVIIETKEGVGQYPFGKFVLDETFPKIAFLSGGIGITPIRSICKYVVDKNLGNNIVLVYANRSIKDVVFKDDFEAMMKSYAGLRVAHVLSEAEPGFKCTVGRINREVIKNEIPDYAERKFYLCGPPQMVEAMRLLLTDELGVSLEMIVTENFQGY